MTAIVVRPKRFLSKIMELIGLFVCRHGAQHFKGVWAIIQKFNFKQIIWELKKID